MDRRVTPWNGRVAALSLQGKVQADRFTAGTPARVAVPVEDLRPAPGAMRDRQLLMGTPVTVYDREDGWSFVQSARDGYVGWLRTGALAAPRAATHRVAVPATHVYAAEDMKTQDLMHLSFGCEVTVTAERRRFWETPEGFIPKPHLRPLDRPFADPVTVAQLFFGVPYLWGGNSVLGIDCSGLVQAAHLACGIACPGDSDMQRRDLGQEAEGDPQRGDLWFWKGHVALVVDPATILHANAHHMAVAYEGLAAAVARIEAQGDGGVTARKRLGRNF